MKGSLRSTSRALSIASMLCVFAVAGQAKADKEVVIVGPDPLPVEIVPSPDGGTRACALYDDSHYFQLNTIFNGTSTSYDTLIRTDDSENSFVVTRVVVHMIGDAPGIGSIILSFNTPGSVIDPGISIDPLPTGNLGIQFPPSHQVVSGRFATAIFEPDYIDQFSTSMRVRLMDQTGGVNVDAVQAAVAISGCLLAPSGP